MKIEPNKDVNAGCNLSDEIEQAEYLMEICRESPFIKIATKFGEGKYEFKRIGFRNEKPVLEFELVMDSINSDCHRIAYNLGVGAILTAKQYLRICENGAYT